VQPSIPVIFYDIFSQSSPVSVRWKIVQNAPGDHANKLCSGDSQRNMLYATLLTYISSIGIHTLCLRTYGLYAHNACDVSGRR